MNKLLATPLRVLALVAVGSSMGCAAAEEEPAASSTQNIDARFNPSHPAPNQVDSWSCSVHTTTWMLQATGHDVTWDQVSNAMLKTGRVTTSQGLSDAGGSGLAATLKDFASDGPSIDSAPYVSFEDVAARAGQMAVGIGGRAWNHWSAVSGYDAARGVLILANSAPGFKGVGQELDRDEFASLGGMAMVWMDFGQTPPPPPFEPSPRPAGGEFQALHVKTTIGADQFITQCSEAADGERVWLTSGSGPDPETRWAEPKYSQGPSGSCGEPGAEGHYPLVFRSLGSGGIAAWVTQCSGQGDGAAHVFRVDTEVDGHPAAVFLYNESTPDCL